MARAKLHIICGNCGCNDEFSFELVMDGNDCGDGTVRPAAWIRCGNCSTLHDLGDTMPEKENDNE